MTLVQELIEIFGPLPEKKPKPSEEQLELATALTVFADWLGSDERFLSDPLQNTPEKLRKRANEILDEIGWIPPKPIRSNNTFAQIFGDGFTPNAIQSALYETANRPGVFIVEAPMGTGKTEAALWGARRLIEAGCHQGIYFALPTRTTSDKIHERMEEYLQQAFEGNCSARLLHSTAWMRLYDLTKIQNSSGWSETD